MHRRDIWTESYCTVVVWLVQVDIMLPDIYTAISDAFLTTDISVSRTVWYSINLKQVARNAGMWARHCHFFSGSR